MKEEKCTIIENQQIAPGVYQLVLAAEQRDWVPGQFAELAIPGKFLRRPISICHWEDGLLTFLYKVVGEGTKTLSELQPAAASGTMGGYLDLLLPLGNGYEMEDIPAGAMLVGGGMGVPPMYGLAKALALAGKRPKVLLGFNTAEEVFYEKEFATLGELGVDVQIKVGGFVTEVIPRAASSLTKDQTVPTGNYICACGPEAMLRAVDRLAAHGQYSLEARMACGFGACMGCSIEILDRVPGTSAQVGVPTGLSVKSARVCKEGPVFRKEVLGW